MSSVNKKFKKTKCEKCGKSIYVIEDGHGIQSGPFRCTNMLVKLTSGVTTYTVGVVEGFDINLGYAGGVDDCLCPDCWNRWCKFHKENGARYMKAYPFKQYKIANPAYQAFLGKLGSEIGFVLS